VAPTLIKDNFAIVLKSSLHNH